MNKNILLKFKIILVVFCSLVLLKAHCIESLPQNDYPIILDNKIIFSIKTPLGSISPQTRAHICTQKIKKLARTYSFNPKEIRIIDQGNYTVIKGNNESIATITNDDAKLLHENRAIVGFEYKNKIIEAINLYREKRNYSLLLRSSILAILATLAFLFFLKSCLLLYTFIIKKLINKGKQLNPIKLQRLNILTTSTIIKIILSIARVLKIIIILSITYFYFIFLFSLFPWTSSISEHALKNSALIIDNVFFHIISYIPNIFIIILTIVLTKYISNFTRYFFDGLKHEKIIIPGFYKEWADPTIKILQFFLWAMSLAIISPYLPYSNTDAFKGVSVFIGALITFGSGTSMSNIMAGIILTYTRAFNIGDRLKISDTFGDVVEKNLLVTRIQTTKQEVISIPNSIVLQSHIINYSQNTSECSGVILHTSITIGYDAPWRQIHELLISAALDTENILDTPKPFVLQTALNDFFVTYEINAYTDKPSAMLNTYSSLHQNIQDKFNEAGVEIMSPHYNSLRNGNSIAIPEEYKATNYQEPKFNINLNAQKND